MLPQLLLDTCPPMFLDTLILACPRLDPRVRSQLLPTPPGWLSCSITMIFARCQDPSMLLLSHALSKHWLCCAGCQALHKDLCLCVTKVENLPLSTGPEQQPWGCLFWHLLAVHNKLATSPHCGHSPLHSGPAKTNGSLAAMPRAAAMKSL